jgi:hypothetical protein
MRYLLLCCADEQALAALPQAEWEHLVTTTRVYVDELRARGCCVSATMLESARAATTVRVRYGKPSTTDGPYAETSEQVRGLFVIEARDLDDALRVASGFPSARHGSIEVRPIRGARE